MRYNPQIHHRRSIRLKGYDYSQAGAYFITICCHQMKCRFGNIVVGASLAGAQNVDEQNTNAQMILNDFGTIAYDEWVKLTERFSNVELDVFQIMPNHMHGIIVLNDIGAGASPAPAVGDIVGAYKSLVANACLEIFKLKLTGDDAVQMGKLWQRDYYEHIIRNGQSYQNISNYIVNNPSKWIDDKFYRR